MLYLTYTSNFSVDSDKHCHNRTNVQEIEDGEDGVGGGRGWGGGGWGWGGNLFPLSERLIGACSLK